MKLTIGQPRPFWVSLDVKELEWVCYLQYGNPSGHSMLGPMIYQFFLGNFFLSRYPRSLQKPRIIIVIFYIILMSLIFFCRLYLGMHSYNQIFLGSTCGVLCIILYRFYLEEQIANMIVFLTLDQQQLESQGVYQFPHGDGVFDKGLKIAKISKKQIAMRKSQKMESFNLDNVDEDYEDVLIGNQALNTRLSNSTALQSNGANIEKPTQKQPIRKTIESEAGPNDVYRFVMKKQKEIVCTHVIVTVIIIISSVTLYFLIKENTDHTKIDLWRRNIINQCQLTTFNEIKAFYNRCFVDASIISACLSIIIGLYFTKSQFYLTNKYVFNGKYKLITEILSVAIIMMLIGLVFLVFTLIPHQTDAVVYYIVQFLQLFTAASLLIAYIPLLLIQIQFISPKDPTILQVEEEEDDDDQSSFNGSRKQFNEDDDGQCSKGGGQLKKQGSNIIQSEITQMTTGRNQKHLLSNTEEISDDVQYASLQKIKQNNVLEESDEYILGNSDYSELRDQKQTSDQKSSGKNSINYED